VWTAVIALIVVVGLVLVVTSRSDKQQASATPPAIGDHWHAFLGFDACGTWLNHTPVEQGDTGIGAPPFEFQADNGSIRAGLHSHGDGLMHIHPFSSGEGGNNATVGEFLRYGGWSANADSFKVWDNKTYRTGGKCGTGANAKPAVVQWAVGHFGKPWTGKPRSGSPSDYHPKNGDIVAVYFLPKGEKLIEPPDAQSSLANISDLGGAPAKPGVTPSAPPGSTPGPSTTPSSAPSTATTAAPTAPSSTPSTTKP
jgi:hypothetical protein